MPANLVSTLLLVVACVVGAGLLYSYRIRERGRRAERIRVRLMEP